MKITFVQDYIGRETAMQERKAGESLDAPLAQALELIRMGVVEEIIEEKEPAIIRQPKRKAKGEPHD